MFEASLRLKAPDSWLHMAPPASSAAWVWGAETGFCAHPSWEVMGAAEVKREWLALENSLVVPPKLNIVAIRSQKFYSQAYTQDN